ALHLLDEALRRLHLDDLLQALADLVEALRAECEAHAPLRAELVDQERVLRAARVLEEERRPARLDRAIDDLGDLEVAVDRGRDAVFHVAALYSYDAAASELERINVEGTRVVVELCREEGVRRLVHTSTAGTCGPVPGRAATEEDEPPTWELRVPYKRTKLEAERIALA